MKARGTTAIVRASLLALYQAAQPPRLEQFR